MASHPFSATRTKADPPLGGPMRAALLESLYCDMLLLADEVRAGPPPDDGAADPLLRVRIACESLRLSARLMRMTQLLLDHRAGRSVPDRLCDKLTGPLDVGPLPQDLAAQLDGATRLERRLAELVQPTPLAPPAIVTLQEQLSRRFE